MVELVTYKIRHHYPVEVEGETEDPHEFLRFIDMLPKIVKEASKLWEN